MISDVRNPPCLASVSHPHRFSYFNRYGCFGTKICYHGFDLLKKPAVIIFLLKYEVHWISISSQIFFFFLPLLGCLLADPSQYDNACQLARNQHDKIKHQLDQLTTDSCVILGQVQVCLTNWDVNCFICVY